jgi:sulfur carrier protein
VSVNGIERELPEPTTVAHAVRLLGVGDDERGVAVALDAEVVPRDRWTEVALAAGARLEVVRAAAGG